MTTTDTPPTAADKALVTEDWTYLGRRIGAGNKRIYVWQALGHPDAPRHVFAKQIVKGYPVPVGSTWRITSEADETDRFFVGGEHRPVAIGRPEYVTDEKVVGWAAEDAGAELEYRQLTAQKALAEQVPDLHEALLPIKVALGRQRGRVARAAIIAAVLAELERW